MSAVAYRLRAALVRRWVATLALSVVVAAIFGAVLACAAGARRTATAPDRYTRSVGWDYDAMVTQQNGGRPLTGAVAQLPGVATAESITFVFGGLISPRTSADGPVDALTFGGSIGALPARLVAGREPDPAAPGEFVATQSFLDLAHASIGDVFHLVSLSQTEADTNGFDSATHSGPQLDATLVGVIQQLSPVGQFGPVALVSPALLDLPGLGVSQTLIAVRLRSGVDVTELRNELDTLPHAEGLSIDSGDLVNNETRRAVRTQAVAMWLLAAVAAVAAVIVLGVIVSRFARIAEAERERLRAIGFTDRLVLLESCGNALIPIAAGGVLATAAAVVPSMIFPTGFARRLEPDTGVDIDVPVLVLGAAALTAVLAVCVVVVLAVGGRRGRIVARPSAIEAIAARAPSAVMSTGVRFAFGRASRTRSTAPGFVVGIAASVALLVGAVEFGVSTHRLLDEPSRYGINYDLALGGDGSLTLPDGLQQTVEADPDVSEIVLYASAFGRHGQVGVQLLGMTVIQGDGAPAITAGRLPTANDEVALGRNTAHDLGASVGGAVELEGSAGVRTYRVTGITVVPGFGANEGVGSGAVMTMAALQMLEPAARPNAMAVSVAGARREAVQRLADRIGLQEYELFRPDAIVNVSRISNIPFVLAALMGALCLLTVVTAAVGSVRGRHRDFAVLRALGAGGRWVTMAVGWQTTLLAALPAAGGAVLGVILGRQVFTRFADSMGAIDDAATPLRATLLILVVLAVVANLAVVLPGRAVRRVSPAARLHAE